MTLDLFLKIKLKLIAILLSSLPARIAVSNQDSKELRDEICSFDLGSGNEWIPMLGEIQREFRISTTPTSRFLEYKSIQGPLHPNQQYLSIKYIKAIEASAFELSSDERYVISQLLTDEQFGCPNFSYLYPQSSTLNIQHVHHIITIRRHLEVDFESLGSIYEFGGGYGNLARLIFKTGFTGGYSIFDFELMGAIQKYYLSRAAATADKVDKFQFISSFDHFGQNLANTGYNKSFFIATWSMSESPLEIRELLYDKLLQSVKYIYITFQKRWHDVDNLDYFLSLSRRLVNHKCLIVPCSIFSGNYYLIATKR